MIFIQLENITIVEPKKQKKQNTKTKTHGNLNEMVNHFLTENKWINRISINLETKSCHFDYFFFHIISQIQNHKCN